MKNYKLSDSQVKSWPVYDLGIYNKATNKAKNTAYFNLEMQNVW